MRKINDSGAYKTGIDCKNNFKIDYIYDTSKRENIKKIKDAAKTAKIIYVASDGDREGDGIAAEVQDLLKQYKSKLVRIKVEEITDKAIKAAIKNPIPFDDNMANASESRSVLDKLVGYRTSNIVLSKIGAPSAGRVQSALLRILAEKEETIQKFKSSKYYEIFLDFKKGPSNLTAKLCQIKDKKIDRIKDKKIAEDVIANCHSENYTIEKITEKEKKIEPKLPLTTATMQQYASNNLGWAPAKTQKNAQTLYESGYITYIRTDAVRFSEEFIGSAKEFINKNYNGMYRGLNIPEEKNKDAQNAHESIRPTDITKIPSALQQTLETDQFKLYKLIYNYSLSALFKPATVKDTDVLIQNKDYHFKISGRQIVEETFLQFFNDLDDIKKLPAFKIGEKVNDKELYFEEKETQPPQRYSEAGLVKLMQESGIGRPSTFSPTIETLKKREYIKIDKKAVYVTELGMQLNKLLKEHFPDTFDPTYTSKMEEKLDDIASGKITELQFLSDFWKEFEPVVLKAAREINKDKPKAEQVEGVKCPKCGKNLVYRVSKTGNKFIACSGFPKCKFTAPTLEEMDVKKKELKSEVDQINCPECGIGYMVQRTNKKTKETFWACSRFKEGCHKTFNNAEMQKYLELLETQKKENFNDK